MKFRRHRGTFFLVFTDFILTYLLILFWLIFAVHLFPKTIKKSNHS